MGIVRGNDPLYTSGLKAFLKKAQPEMPSNYPIRFGGVRQDVHEATDGTDSGLQQRI
jgi:hypothetical protein